ncbi:MAG TPA: hypothetical protein VMW73_03225, partial [Spirochaetia bacterium]|nr:hypothetical protein [Spirochaetia bacterium]
MPKQLRYFATLCVVTLSLSACAASSQSSVLTGMARYGYPHVLASMNLQAGQSGTITVPDQFANGRVNGSMTIAIPSDAFSVPVRFEVLTGKNRDWNAAISPGAAVIANIAYRVTDLKNGSLIKRFNAPIEFTVTDPMITSSSQYLETTPARPPEVINANAATQISGDSL